MPGSLHLLVGPMFSGKTTRIIQIYKTRTYIGKRVAVINYSEDKRYHETMLSTHDKIMIPCMQTTTLGEIWREPAHLYHDALKRADTVLINEGQFFNDLYEIVLEMVEKERKEVFICGLDGDFKRQVFGQMLDLIPYCDTIEKLNSLCADCRDGTLAIFSHRLTLETEQIVVGADNYVPLCRNCYTAGSQNV